MDQTVDTPVRRTHQEGCAVTDPTSSGLSEPTHSYLPVSYTLIPTPPGSETDWAVTREV